MAELHLYNTRTRAIEPLRPIDAGHVRIYTCGPTVYAAQHIGNLRSQMFADLLKRAILAEGYRVTQVINVTDVGHLTDDADAGEDKMEKAAQATGKRADEIARFYTDQWLRDRARVGCLAPDVLCRATDHIPEQIEMTRTLEAKGYAYTIADGVYFDTAKFPGYADFARLNLAEEGESRIGEVSDKRHPADFALWKFAGAGVHRQQEWDSPWGRGFPGWHIECSAMSTKYLGDNFDIHTGGVDHVKVHHTNEIAQSECALGVSPWVSIWMHHEFLTFAREKMSKSLGNIVVLDQLVEQGITPRGFRYFFLQAHYRQQQTVSDEALEAAERGYQRLLRAAVDVRAAAGAVDGERIAPFREQFRAALRDDLHGPRALAVAWEVARGDLAPAERRALLLEFDEVLALDLATALPSEIKTESDPRIDGLVLAREAARKSKNWAEADRLRDQLKAEGVVIVDGPGGPRWHRG